MLFDRLGGVEHDLVIGRATVLERKVEGLERELEIDDRFVEDAKRLGQQLLAGLVAF